MAESRMRRLGNDAATVISPEDQEAQALKEKQAQIDEYAAANAQPVGQPKSMYQPSSMDRIHPQEKYGTRPGEQRMDVSSFLKPLGSQQQQPPQVHIHMSPAAMQKVPVYDDGGVPDTSNLQLQQPDYESMDPSVSAPNVSFANRMAGAAKGMGNASEATDPNTMPGQGAVTRMYPVTGLSGTAPIMDEGGKVEPPAPDLKKVPVMGMTKKLHDEVKQSMMSEPEQYPKSTAASATDEIDPEELTKYNESKAPKMKVPVYDDGGPVKDDPTDGHHQLAVLEEGERVLTPEQNAQYEQEQGGAPADFAGRVMSQPNPPIRPMMDTEAPEADRISGGAKPDITNAGADAQHPVADVSPDAMRTMSARVAPTMGPGTIPSPSDKAAGVGQPTPKMQNPATGAPVGEGAAPEHNPMATTTKATPLPNEREKLEAERAALKQKMVDAAEGRNNNGKFDHIAYGEAKMALADLNKAHPWGQPGNHEGFFGKLGHGLATAGEIASDVVLGPGITSMIPGTRENLSQQAASGQEQISQGLAQQATEAETGLKKAQAQVAGQPKSTDEAIARAQFRLQHTQPGTPEHDTAQKEYDAALATQKQEKQNAVDVKPQDLAHQIADLAQQAVGMPEGSPERADIEKKMTYLQSQQQQASKLTDRRREILAHGESMGLDMKDPATLAENYNKAVQDYEKTKTASKAEGGFPTWQKKADIQSNLTAARDLLIQQNAKANEFGLKAAELQQKGDQDYIKSMGHITLINKGLESSNASQVASNIIPLMATLNVAHDVGGISRLNKQELDAFAPGHGSLTRWLSANWDRVAVGELPDNYQKDIAGLMKDLSANVNQNHDAYTESVDKNFRQHAQVPTPKPNKKGGTSVTPAVTPPQAPTGGLTGMAAWNQKRQQQKQQTKP
jgi:hypothetical protein